MFLRDVASHDTPRPMSVKRKRAWSSLGSGLLWAIALSGCGTHTATPVAAKSDEAVVESAVTQSLQRQIRERDKRIAELRSQIAELTSQLEALKVIDQDMDERKKSSRPPATLTPIELDQSR
jgi:TolA-binding protein